MQVDFAEVDNIIVLADPQPFLQSNYSRITNGYKYQYRLLFIHFVIFLFLFMNC